MLLSLRLCLISAAVSAMLLSTLSACAPKHSEVSEVSEVSEAPEAPEARDTLSFDSAPVPPRPAVTGLTEEQQAALLQRVWDKWRAQVRGDHATAYLYTTPNYRKVFTKRMYFNKFASDLRLELTEIDLLHYDAKAAVASVGIRVMSESINPTTSAARSGRFINTVKERWILIDGEWWNNAKL